MTAHFGSAQGIHERSRLTLQCLLTECHGFDRAAQAAEAFRAFFFDAQDLLLGLAQRFADRCEHGFDCFLALRQRSDRGLLVLTQVLACELEKDFAVGTQRCAGDRIEVGLQTFHGAFERGLALAFELLLGLDLRPEDRQFEMQRLAFLT